MLISLGYVCYSNKGPQTSVACNRRHSLLRLQVNPSLWEFCFMWPPSQNPCWTATCLSNWSCEEGKGAWDDVPAFKGSIHSIAFTFYRTFPWKIWTNVYWLQPGHQRQTEIRIIPESSVVEGACNPEATTSQESLPPVWTTSHSAQVEASLQLILHSTVCGWGRLTQSFWEFMGERQYIWSWGSLERVTAAVILLATVVMLRGLWSTALIVRVTWPDLTRTGQGYLFNAPKKGQLSTAASLLCVLQQIIIEIVL